MLKKIIIQNNNASSGPWQDTMDRHYSVFSSLCWCFNLFNIPGFLFKLKSLIKHDTIWSICIAGEDVWCCVSSHKQTAGSNAWTHIRLLTASVSCIMLHTFSWHEKLPHIFPHRDAQSLNLLRLQEFANLRLPIKIEKELARFSRLFSVTVEWTRRVRWVNQLPRGNLVYISHLTVNGITFLAE